jgi:putative endonuclease
MFYYTYILRTNHDDQMYIGWTIDLKGRLVEHNKGKVYSTKNKIPWKLEYYEACLNKESAIMREKQLKTGFSRAYLKRRLT